MTNLKQVPTVSLLPKQFQFKPKKNITVQSLAKIMEALDLNCTAEFYSKLGKAEQKHWEEIK